jgi:RNA polymerase sigma-70 factor (ECF subfamily)
MFADLAVPDSPAVSPKDRLVERLRQGDPAALAEAYDHHHAAVRAFAWRLVGDADAAEDLVHDVFVALGRAIHGFQGASSLQTFLLGLAINLARHHLRSAARRRAALERYSREPGGSAPSPEHAAGNAALARALTAALDELPLEQRVAFVLCEVEERTAREASEIVQAPEATMRTRLFHARQKLKASLQRRGFE